MEGVCVGELRCACDGCAADDEVGIGEGVGGVDGVELPSVVDAQSLNDGAAVGAVEADAARRAVGVGVGGAVCADVDLHLPSLTCKAFGRRLGP